MCAPHAQQSIQSATNAGKNSIEWRYVYYEGANEMDMNIWMYDNEDNKRFKVKNHPRRVAPLLRWE